MDKDKTAIKDLVRQTTQRKLHESQASHRLVAETGQQTVNSAAWISQCSCVNSYCWDYQGPQPYTQYRTSHHVTDPNTGQLVCWEIGSTCD